MENVILYLYHQVAALWKQSLKLFGTAAVLIYYLILFLKKLAKYHMMVLLTVVVKEMLRKFLKHFILGPYQKL